MLNPLMHGGGEFGKQLELNACMLALARPPSPCCKGDMRGKKENLKEKKNSSTYNKYASK